MTLNIRTIPATETPTPMSKSKRWSVSTSANIKAEQVARLLGRAGWEWRRDGSHYNATKSGYPTIRFQEPFDTQSWDNVEKALGIALDTLVHKQLGRTGVKLEEWRHRVSLASDLHNAGFPVKFVVKHSGLSDWYNQGWRPSQLLDTTPDDMIARWSRYGDARVLSVPAVSSAPSAAIAATATEQIPFTTIDHNDEPVEVELPEVEAIEQPNVPFTLPFDVIKVRQPGNDDMTAMLELMGAMDAKLSSIRAAGDPDLLPRIRTAVQELDETLGQLHAALGNLHLILREAD